MKIRIEYTYEEEAIQVINDLKKLYNVKTVSKVYYNRYPSKQKRRYLNVELKNVKI